MALLWLAVLVLIGVVGAGTAAAQTTDGAIAGKLLDWRTGAPAAGVCVNLYTPPSAGPFGGLPIPAGPFDPAVCTGPPSVQSPDGTTGPGGTYTVTGVPAGTYLVEFHPQAPSPYVDQWYPDQSQPGSAQRITVVAGQTTTLSVELAEPPGTVAGRVTNRHGKPLAGILINAEACTPPGTRFGCYGGPPDVPTNSDGAYAITGLAPGEWQLQALGTPTYPGFHQRTALVGPGAVTQGVNFTMREASKLRLAALTLSLRSGALTVRATVSVPAVGGWLSVRGLRRGRVVRLSRSFSVPGKGGARRFTARLRLPRADRTLHAVCVQLAVNTDPTTRGGSFVRKVKSDQRQRPWRCRQSFFATPVGSYY